MFLSFKNKYVKVSSACRKSWSPNTSPSAPYRTTWFDSVRWDSDSWICCSFISVASCVDGTCVSAGLRRPAAHLSAEAEGSGRPPVRVPLQVLRADPERTEPQKLTCCRCWLYTSVYLALSWQTTSHKDDIHSRLSSWKTSDPGTDLELCQWPWICEQMKNFQRDSWEDESSRDLKPTLVLRFCTEPSGHSGDFWHLDKILNPLKTFCPSVSHSW